MYCSSGFISLINISWLALPNAKKLIFDKRITLMRELARKYVKYSTSFFHSVHAHWYVLNFIRLKWKARLKICFLLIFLVD